jgi:hypothetical protein
MSGRRGEIEAREFVKFENQPRGLHFRLMSKEGSASVYKQGEKKTDQLHPKCVPLQYKIERSLSPGCLHYSGASGLCTRKLPERR